MVGKGPNAKKPRSGRRASRPASRKRGEPAAPANPNPPAAGGDETVWRVARVIARAGLASRREAEEWIAAGRVAINGTIIKSPAVNITVADQVMIDGKPLPARERTRLFLYHKPRGLVTTSADPQGRPTIFDALPADLPRLVSVGRLDLASEGLLLLTNDGGLARMLELPATGWLRRYRVRAHGRVTQEQLDRLQSGTTVDGIRYGPIEATVDRTQGTNVWLTVALREGKNREVRNVLGAMGLQVNRLIRISFGPFQLGELNEGEVQEVRTRTLREQIGERLAAAAGADFSAPPRMTERRRDGSGATPARKDAEPRASNDHVRRSAGPRRPTPRLQRDDRDHSSRRESERAGGEAPRRAADRMDHQEGAQHRSGQPAKRKARGSRGSHVWRDHDAPPRVFSKSRRHRGASGPPAELETDPVPRPKRLALVRDRKGRRVLIERIGDPKTQSASPQRDDPKRRSDDRRGRPKGRR